jgi:AcrR family transcriptional regulator
MAALLEEAEHRKSRQSRRWPGWLRLWTNRAALAHLQTGTGAAFPFAIQRHQRTRKLMPAAKPKPEMLASLLRAFRRYGYDGASLARLSTETGLKPASLYRYFPGGKEEMARAVVTSAIQDFNQLVLAPLRGPGTPEHRVARMTSALSVFYDGGSEPCLLALMTTGEGRKVLAPYLRDGLQGWIHAFASLLAEVGLPEPVARQRAQNAVASVQGALVLAGVLNDTSVFERTVEDLRRKLLLQPTMLLPQA